MPASSWIASRVQPRRAASASMAERWAASPSPESACSAVLTRTYPTTIVLSAVTFVLRPISAAGALAPALTCIFVGGGGRIEPATFGL